VTDAHVSHKAKTCRSMLAAEWAGAWVLRDDQHVAVFLSDGLEWTALRPDRSGGHGGARQGAGGGARSLGGGAGPGRGHGDQLGRVVDAFLLAITSCRLASHANPKLITSNYPDADHWVSRRFIESPAPGRVCIRIKPGEWAGDQQRAEWREALKDRPDLLRRLLEGQPGTIALGAQVAVGFNKDLHVAKERLSIQHGGALVIGWDAGHQPSAILGQRVADGTIAVYASLTTDGGTLQVIEDEVLPWLRTNAPWALRSSPGDRRLMHAIDPSMRTGASTTSATRRSR
jgi:hypothetical protein